MSKQIFHIENLQCKYKATLSPALYVEKLSINKGDVVFIVGPSGGGKSTILETLGLMNNTVDFNNSGVFNFSDFSDKQHDLLNVWQKSEKSIAELRKKNFSFIFQNTDLFPSLAVRENIILPALLQEGKNNKINKKLNEILFDIAPELTGKEQITKISGGQKQRVAFARAVLASYYVLLADEPTGNLDFENASNLMEKLMAYLKEKQTTAVIVTHDISLALKHASKVVLINISNNGKSENQMGNVSSLNTFNRDNGYWMRGVNNKDKFTSEELFEILRNKPKRKNDG